MSFNPDRTKQAQDIIFRRKKPAKTHPSLFFNNSEIMLRLTLNSKLLLNEHMNDEIHQANKCVSLLRKLQTIPPRTSLLAIYKSFLRRFLDYAGVIYDQPSNVWFSKQIESVQHNAVLPIIGAIKGCLSWKIVAGLKTGISLSKKMDEKIVLTL